MESLLLKDSGKTVQIRKVSPLLAMQLRRDFPEPRPPKNKVTDLNGREVWEENPADPDYLQTLVNYENELEERMRKLIVLRGVQVEINKAEVDEVKAFWKETYNTELAGSDKEIYVLYVCIGSPEDMEDLTNAVMKRSQPTAEEINAAKQSFKS